MIKDRLENAEAYAPLGPGIARAMQYLRQTDLSRLEPGRYEIDGDRVFVVVQRYRPKPLSEAAWESHYRYIDVQCVIEGAERMGHLALRAGPRVIKPYDPETDLIFYEPGTDLLVFQAGEFAIFSPQDIHAPGLAVDSRPAGEVLKAVVKVRVDEDRGPCGF
ncbi:MAG: YhcH/YjgK/YiaL family protein [Planctomycetes bacterium]|nr:YhcH/YjgK/YiaL family protein [Planctomycetota bacterium]